MCVCPGLALGGHPVREGGVCLLKGAPEGPSATGTNHMGQPWPTCKKMSFNLKTRPPYLHKLHKNTRKKRKKCKISIDTKISGNTHHLKMKKKQEFGDN